MIRLKRNAYAEKESYRMMERKRKEPMLCMSSSFYRYAQKFKYIRFFWKCVCLYVETRKTPHIVHQLTEFYGLLRRNKRNFYIFNL